MKPCDCIDQYTIDNQLKENGIKINGTTLYLWKDKVVLETNSYSVKFERAIFNRLVQWYLEDHDLFYFHG